MGLLLSIVGGLWTVFWGVGVIVAIFGQTTDGNDRGSDFVVAFIFLILCAVGIWLFKKGRQISRRGSSPAESRPQSLTAARPAPGSG
ncbi:MAG: hypothetical protein LBS31_01725, partial [Candidatus Adiutrix sp.]|nr:hypothetical protein [Candidatus Adiutrix sp.]